MTKAQLWKTYCDKNPSFLGVDSVCMSPKGLKKLFDQTYDNAHAQAYGEAMVEVARGMKNTKSNLPTGFEELFGGIFGKKK